MKQFPANSSILAHELAPVIERIEQSRLHSHARIRQGWQKIAMAILIAGASCLALAVILKSFPQQPQLMMLTAAPLPIALIYCVVIYSKYISGHKSAYCAAYKKQVIGGLTKLLHPEVNYSPFRGISEHAFKETGLYSGSIDRYNCEDMFHGKIGDTELMFSEIHAEEKHTRSDSDGRTSTYYEDIFKGVFFIADFNKHIRGWVTVKPDFAEKSFGWFGRKIQSFNPKLVRLENPDFERAFVVHSNDQVETRYILTPDLQERLLKLRKWLNPDIRLSLYRSKLHLTVPIDNDWFEPSFHLPASDLSQMQSFLNQMVTIFELVRILDLNTRIWSKGA